MPPNMMKQKAVKKMVEKRIAKAIAEYEKTRASPDNAGGSGSVDAGGIHAPKNRRQETARDYVAAPADGKGYVGNLPKCNRCNSHHNRQCPLKCPRCHRAGHHEKDYRVKLTGEGDNSMQNVTCYGCGEKGHLRNKCPKRTNQPNEGAHGRAYVMRNKKP
ncbi:putative reverse transcriptase domain-containing protein [Tanacetum coccineum]